MGAAVAILAQIIPLIGQLASAGVQVADLLAAARKTAASVAAPGSAEWDAVNAALDALEQQLNDDPQPVEPAS